MRVAANAQILYRWETRISPNDIPLVLDYRKSELPDVEERSQQLNIVAAAAIIRGLIAYGWTYPWLARCECELMTCLGKFVDIKRLEHGEIRALEEHGEKRPSEESTEATTKRRCRRTSLPGLDRPLTHVESNVQEISETVAGTTHALTGNASNAEVVRDIAVAENSQAGDPALGPSRISEETHTNVSQLSLPQRHERTSISPDNLGAPLNASPTGLANSDVLQGTASEEAAARSPLEEEQRLAMEVQPYQLSPSGPGLPPTDPSNSPTYMDMYLSGSILSCGLMDSPGLAAAMDEYLLASFLDHSSLTMTAE